MGALSTALSTKLTGIVLNFPRRRRVHPRLFFLELAVQQWQDNDILITESTAEDAAPISTSTATSAESNSETIQVLLKHGQGGVYADGQELETLRQSIRQGDTLDVEIGHCEVLAKTGQVLYHATKAKIIAVHIHGNTGSSYQCDYYGSKAIETREYNRKLEDTSPHHCIRNDDDKLAQQSFTEENRHSKMEQEVHLPSKKERFAIFCDFVIKTFSDNDSKNNDSCSNDDNCHRQNLTKVHFYDIAGGRGELSLLLTLRGYQVTLIDPRENAGMLSSRSRKQLRKSGAGHFDIQRIFFDAQQATALFGNNIALSRSTKPVLLALHPDEATEAVVDAAVAQKLPFAVVPCCVYSRLFPQRQWQGQTVRTHFQFCQYLQAKHAGIQRIELDFGGHATVLYHLGNYS